MFFFFKQKTAYEMRISDWSSDVCSSDLRRETMTKPPLTLCLWYEGDAEEAAAFYAETFADSKVGAVNRAPADSPGGKEGDVQKIGRASCRERGCQYV